MSYKLEQLGEETLILKGSPPTLIRLEDEVAYVVDPGYPDERGVRLKKILQNLDIKDIIVILTHSHNDHILATTQLQPSIVYVPPAEISAIQNFKLRSFISYGFIYTKGLSLLEAGNIEKCRELETGKSYGGFIPVSLPGHTFGHHGVLTSDNILYVSDAMFGDKLLDKVGIPFVQDHVEFLESLQKISEFSRYAEKIILAHGPRIKKTGDLKHILDANRARILEIKEGVLSLLQENTLHVEEITSTLLIKYNIKVTATSLLLSLPLVKSITSELYKEGLVRPILADDVLKWRKQA